MGSLKIKKEFAYRQDSWINTALPFVFVSDIFLRLYQKIKKVFYTLFTLKHTPSKGNKQ